MSNLCTYFFNLQFCMMIMFWQVWDSYIKNLSWRTLIHIEFIDHFGLVCVDMGCVCVFASLRFLFLCDIGMLGLCTYVFFHVYKIQIGIVVVVVMTTLRNLLTFSIFAILLFSFVICFNQICCTMYFKKYLKF